MKPRSTQIHALAFLFLLIASLFAFGGVALASGNQQQAQFIAPKLVVNVSFLNVRTGPGVQYTVLLTVVGGTELPVLGVFADRVWYQVSTPLGVGWVNVTMTLPRGDFRAVPFVEAPPVTVGLVVQDASTLAALGQGGGGVAAPAVSGAIVGGVQPGGLPWGVSIVGGDFHQAPTTSSVKLELAMSPDPSTIYALQNITYAEGTNWYQLTIPDLGTGWLMEQFITIRPIVCPGSNLSAAVMLQDVFLQGGPDALKPPAYPVRVGQEVYVRDVRRGRTRVELFTRDTGWIAVEATQGRDESKIRTICGGAPVVPGAAGVPSVVGAVPGAVPMTGVTTTAGLAAPRIVINTGFLNVRSGPGAQYSVVATLPGGSEIPVVGIASDGVWFLVQGPFGQGWVNNEFTLFRGDIDNVPVIRGAVGALATPMATISSVVTLYAAPNASLGTVGAISGPAQVPVVARTPDGTWVQLNTSLGFGWVPANQVTLIGDISQIPIVQS